MYCSIGCYRKCVYQRKLNILSLDFGEPTQEVKLKMPSVHWESADVYCQWDLPTVRKESLMWVHTLHIKNVMNKIIGCHSIGAINWHVETKEPTSLPCAISWDSQGYDGQCSGIWFNASINGTPGIITLAVQLQHCFIYNYTASSVILAVSSCLAGDMWSNALWYGGSLHKRNFAIIYILWCTFPCSQGFCNSGKRVAIFSWVLCHCCNPSPMLVLTHFNLFYIKNYSATTSNIWFHPCITIASI